ncbi:A24 family peptidase [Pragia fontium]|uniref:Prepilin peptidase CpaA n=2 Tax=Pragia fontium TaxID=82985 RepID=A0AAJ5BG20_9GAMM|nr:prepilin peptidase [Pragia fontium]GKX63303.1 tight adherance operon protein [Pragia fontium]SFC13834.1 prepilin peptidase CpaA [Pragia fontium DSM 5563 = ATCC 49100]SUB81318.1 Flp pilus assembly protein, protease CpaA [Pragia fontium]VEJ53490.1 Flp pilus assembly protein, protease CpaA [Pragia fontium]
MTLIVNGLTAIIFILLIWISYTDIRTRIISNKAVIAIFVISLLLGIFSHQSINFLAALSFLLIGFILFHLNVMGAGDVKLISVLSLCLTAEQIWPFLWLTAVLGGFLACIGLLFFRKSVRSSGVPYGPAIAGGFFFVLLTQLNQ